MNSLERFLLVVLIAILGVGAGYKFHGVHGQSVTITGPMPGVMFIYDSTGAPLVAYSCTLLTGTTTTSGTFSLSGTSPTYNGVSQWANPGSAWVEAIRVTGAGTSNVNQSYTASPVTLTATSSAVSLSGTVLSPTTLIVLGATSINASVAKPISAEVCSN